VWYKVTSNVIALNTAINPLNDELNPIYHLLALLGGATIVVVSRLRVNLFALAGCEGRGVLEMRKKKKKSIPERVGVSCSGRIMLT
jgi:hypothetical protein